MPDIKLKTNLVAVLIPLQLRMIRYCFRCIEIGKISKKHREASRSWAVFGIAATATAHRDG
ncbi:hypothetical protein EN829_049500 [Mesorhizobium sp. M00.F.Ca.ET.186.01.1.1]|nr:hypothetical protein EN829_049500 [Mesorhizobium sp. M00.F.Ca.ET.186.01.1.1]